MQRSINIVVRFSAHSLLWLVISYQETMKAVWFCLGRVAEVRFMDQYFVSKSPLLWMPQGPFIIRKSETVVKDRRAWYSSPFNDSVSNFQIYALRRHSFLWCCNYARE